MPTEFIDRFATAAQNFFQPDRPKLRTALERAVRFGFNEDAPPSELRQPDAVAALWEELAPDRWLRDEHMIFRELRDRSKMEGHSTLQGSPFRPEDVVAMVADATGIETCQELGRESAARAARCGWVKVEDVCWWSVPRFTDHTWGFSSGMSRFFAQRLNARKPASFLRAVRESVAAVSAAYGSEGRGTTPSYFVHDDVIGRAAHHVVVDFVLWSLADADDRFLIPSARIDPFGQDGYVDLKDEPRVRDLANPFEPALRIFELGYAFLGVDGRGVHVAFPRLEADAVGNIR